MLIYHPDKRLDGINLLQFLSASLLEEAGSVANPLADQQGDFRWLGDESGRLAPTHHRSDGQEIIERLLHPSR